MWVANVCLFCVAICYIAISVTKLKETTAFLIRLARDNLYLQLRTYIIYAYGKHSLITLASQTENTDKIIFITYVSIFSLIMNRERVKGVLHPLHKLVLLVQLFSLKTIHPSAYQLLCTISGLYLTKHQIQSIDIGDIFSQFL